MKLYTLWHQGCGRTLILETFDKTEAEAYIKNNCKGYEKNFYICEQGHDD